MRSDATLRAGVPATNLGLYHRLRFAVPDPVAIVEVPAGGGVHATLIVRDIETGRARLHARGVDAVACPADFAPAGGLSADRELATAQAAAECLRRASVTRVVGDRSLPLVYVEACRAAGIAVELDPDLGVAGRRAKDAQELEWLRNAQRATEGAVRLACETIASASVRNDGILTRGGEVLTSERVKAMIAVRLLERGFVAESIVAGPPQSGDCHDGGSGALRTGGPTIVDVFPRDSASRYVGDCTRTVVHGTVPDAVAAMHAAVVEAKAAAIVSVRAGVTADAVHAASQAVLDARGYPRGLPSGPDDRRPLAQHGTGHGVGLDVHEAPLLDAGGPELVVGDVVTVEPGVYALGVGGVRVEDMVAVTAEGCENLNDLPEGLTW